MLIELIKGRKREDKIAIISATPQQPGHVPLPTNLLEIWVHSHASVIFLKICLLEYLMCIYTYIYWFVVTI